MQFESAEAFALQAYPPFCLNPGDKVTGTQDINRGLLTTRAIGPFCMSEGAQSTTQPWNIDTLSMGMERLEKNQISNSLKIDRIFTQHPKFARIAVVVVAAV